MKALTLWEPWASLVAVEEKKVETRIWATKYRGPLAIHAAKKSPPEWLGASRNGDYFQERLALIEKKYGWENGWWKQTAGNVLCIVNLVAVECTELVRVDLGEQEILFGNYDHGRYALFFEMIERFETPIPAKGNRLLWEWKR